MIHTSIFEIRESKVVEALTDAGALAIPAREKGMNDSGQWLHKATRNESSMGHIGDEAVGRRSFH